MCDWCAKGDVPIMTVTDGLSTEELCEPCYEALLDDEEEGSNG
jgi:hypothetical protein